MRTITTATPSRRSSTPPSSCGPFRRPSPPRPHPLPPQRRRPRPGHRRSRSRRRAGCSGARASGRLPGRRRRSSASRSSRSSSASRARPARRRSRGPEPVDEEGNPLDPANAWGEDHCLVARPHGPLRPAARRAHDLHLPRLVRQLQRAGQQPAADARPERPVPLDGARQLPRPVSRPSRRNPAMLLFLERHLEQQVGPERELRARDDGAVLARGRPRRLHRGRRARNGPRADRLAQRLVRGTRRLQLPLRPQLPRQRTEDGVRAERATGTTKTRAPVRQPPAARRRSSSRSCGATSSPAAPDEATLASLQGLYLSARATASGRSSRRSSSTPTSIEGPELVTPPVVYNAGLLRAISRPIDTTAWAWLSANAGQQLFYPPNVSGWDFTRWLDTSTAKARWEMASYVTDEDLPNPWPGKGPTRIQRQTRTAADRAAVSALAYWANPRCPANPQQCIADFAATSCLKGTARAVGAEPLPGDAPERAADADRDLPGHAGELT